MIKESSGRVNKLAANVTIVIPAAYSPSFPPFFASMGITVIVSFVRRTITFCYPRTFPSPALSLSYAFNFDSRISPTVTASSIDR